jgi:putative hydrolase of the HAD superfamily
MNDDLIDLIRSLSEPREPIPTDTEPVLKTLPDIRAVVFDVYGTLLTSGSGDVGVLKAASKTDALVESLAAVGITGVSGEAEMARFFEAIEASHNRSKKNTMIEYPEVDIVEIWRGLYPDMDDHQRFAIEYECRANPTWPMPDMADALEAIRERGLPMGIVSNAQFFTPLLFSAQAGKTLEELGFSPDIGVWSYKLLEGKPSTRLYEDLAELLSFDDIAPEQTLYVGNDIRNDIWPASVVGFKTALFAGDQRSLRWRKDDPRCAEVKPDIVITALSQILKCLG